MAERLKQQRRVKDEGLLFVNFCEEGKIIPIFRDLIVPSKQAPANYVPAAAVTRRGQALSGFTGCKGCSGGFISQR